MLSRNVVGSVSTLQNTSMPNKPVARVPTPSASRIKGGVDFSQLKPAAIAEMVASGKLPMPDSTAELRRQAAIVQAYLSRHTASTAEGPPAPPQRGNAVGLMASQLKASSALQQGTTLTPAQPAGTTGTAEVSPALCGDAPQLLVAAQESTGSHRTYTHPVSSVLSDTTHGDGTIHVTAIARRRKRIVLMPPPAAVSASAHTEPADWEGMRNLKFADDFDVAGAQASELQRYGQPAGGGGVRPPLPPNAALPGQLQVRTAHLQPPLPRIASAAHMSPMRGPQWRMDHSTALGILRDSTVLRRTKIVQHSPAAGPTPLQRAPTPAGLRIAHINVQPAVAASPMLGFACRSAARAKYGAVGAEEVRGAGRHLRTLHALDLVVPAAWHTQRMHSTRVSFAVVGAAQAPALSVCAERGDPPLDTPGMPLEYPTRRTQTTTAQRMRDGMVQVYIATATCGRVVVLLPSEALPAPAALVPALRGPPPQVIVEASESPQGTSARVLHAYADVVPLHAAPVRRMVTPQGRRVVSLSPPPAAGAPPVSVTATRGLALGSTKQPEYARTVGGSTATRVHVVLRPAAEALAASAVAPAAAVRSGSGLARTGGSHPQEVKTPARKVPAHTSH